MAIKGATVVVQYLAWDVYANSGKTGNEAFHYARLVQDGNSPATISSLSASYPTEIDSTNLPGYYQVSISAGENDFNHVALLVTSGTSNVKIEPIHWDNYETDKIETKIDAVDAVVDAILVDTGTSGVAIKAGAIQSVTFSSDAITAATIASDAITVNEIATTAGVKIAESVWDLAATGHTTAGTFGQAAKTTVDAIYASVGSALDTDVTNIKLNVADILVDTKALNSTDSLWATEHHLNEVAADLAEVLAWTGTMTSAAGGVASDVKRLDGNATSAANLDLAFTASYLPKVDLNKINGSVDGVAELGLSGTGLQQGVCYGTPTTSSIISDTASLSTEDDNYKNRLILMTSGVVKNQVQAILGYNGATKTFTTSLWTTAPANDDSFIII